MDRSHSEDDIKSIDGSHRCPYCGQQAPVVWVHGHGQCAACGINIKECCQGDQCEVKQDKKG